MGVTSLVTSLLLVQLSGHAVAAPSSRALPWLHNFAPAAEASDATPGVAERIEPWRAADPSCSASAYGGLALTADVAPAPGTERVLASFTQGVLVLDASGGLIASAAPFACAGSADELVGLAAGDAHIGGPVVALAVTAGGHRASATWLVLYRVADGVVAPVFAGIVERRAGDRTRAGRVTLLPWALAYRAPSGERTFWAYDAAQRRYVPLAGASHRPSVSGCAS